MAIIRGNPSTSPSPSAVPSASHSPSASPSPSPKSEPTVEELLVSDFYKQLSVAAVDLNAASDKLGECVTELDSALKTLNLGISTWVDVVRYGDQSGDFVVHKLGYAKVDGRWGIALRTIEGNDGWPEDSEREQWSFNDAPRSLRIEAVDKIPELLEALIKETKSTSQKIREKTTHARQLTTAINQAAELTPKRK